MSDLHPTSEPPVEGKVTVETAGTWEYDGQVGVYEAGSPWTTVKMENGEERPHRTGLVALVYQNGPLIAAAPGLQKALRGLLDRHVELVASGDCGHWDVEQELAVIRARAALVLVERDE